jgi:hypothetical protein
MPELNLLRGKMKWWRSARSTTKQRIMEVISVPSRFIPFLGQQFGWWTATGNYGDGRCEVVCRCGAVRWVVSKTLRNGYSKSCGCRRTEATRTHGGSASPLYCAWRNMRTRCSDKATGRAKHHYFGRGIRVCPEWQESFVAFRDWALSHGYREGLTIDRKDGNLGYSPENCRWITQQAQLQNTTQNVILEAFGELKCLAEWARDPRCLWCRKRLEWRLAHGMSLEVAMTAPPLRGRSIRQFLKTMEVVNNAYKTN